MSELAIHRTGPSINRGKSEQNVGTPRAFIDAVEARFGPLGWDLAATSANRIGRESGTGREDYFGPDHPRPEYRDALATDWDIDGNLWLNPPFSNIAPWAAKCASVRERHGWTLMLVPASVGSNWYREHVQDKCFELYLNGRITFVGSTQPYPKDMAIFAFGWSVRGRDTWRWRDQIAAPSPEPAK